MAKFKVNKEMFRGTTFNKSNFHRPEGAGNFDNMDDVNIVKTITAQTGTFSEGITAKDGTFEDLEITNNLETENLKVNNQAIITNSLGVGVTSTTYPFDVQTTSTATTGYPTQSYESFRAIPTANTGARYIGKRIITSLEGIYNFTQDGHTPIFCYMVNQSSGLVNTMTGANFRAENLGNRSGAGNVALNNMYGFTSESYHSTSNSRVSNLIGFFGRAANSQSGQVGTAIGSDLQITNYGGGTMTSAIAGRFLLSNTYGLMTSARGFLLQALPIFQNNNETRIAVDIEAIPSVGAYTGCTAQAINLQGTSRTAADGLLIGGDTNLYSGAANTLKTDDKFEAASADIGDGTNYTEIKSNGEINLHGTARVIKRLQINVGQIKGAGINPAEYVAYGLNGAFEFSKTLDENVAEASAVPLDIDRSVAPKFIIGWSSPETTGTCVWSLQVLYRAENEDWSSTTPDDTIEIEASPSTTANGLVLTEFTLPTLSSTDAGIVLRLTRLGTDADDDMDDVAYLFGAALDYTSNKFGTAL